ncbi:uncharacterized protein LOC131158285 [Malania oleifera]|uniref:uncharacterized protein LOC131158285 n=1 Tax=Malania oleifera TaxID=397392 RepID=UPI0025AEB321|nr:uncharacterized protein LOC131158285 [Malania oleifera]
MIVSQYIARFIELSPFALHLAPDQEKKARKFKEGLRQNLFKQVIGFWAQMFAEVVDRATIIESGMQRGVVAKSERKRPTPQDFHASSIQDPWRGERYGGSQGRMMGHSSPQGGCTIPTYPTCGRSHPSECRMGEDVCYCYRRPEHKSWSCQGLLAHGPAPRQFQGGNQVPRRGQQRDTALARVYALMSGNTEAARDVVIARPTGSFVRCRRILRDFPVVIQGKVLPANRVILDMQGFDIILGMDLLPINHASIDCHFKEVIFIPLGEQEYKFLSSHVRSLHSLRKLFR